MTCNDNIACNTATDDVLVVPQDKVCTSSCMNACSLHVCLSVCLSVRLSVCMFIRVQRMQRVDVGMYACVRNYVGK